MSSSVVAILLSDVHWSERKPSARRSEENWRGAQRRHIQDLFKAWKYHKEPPIFVAGDLFDRWNEPVGFVNYISNVLDAVFPDYPIFYTVPGNHDLPGHSIYQQHESAYQALHYMQRDRFVDLKNRSWYVNGLSVRGYPWGADTTKSIDAYGPSLAVVHKYAYVDEDSSCGVVPSDSAYRQGVPGATVTHYGDNHIPFNIPGICNPGSFDVRTKTDIENNASNIGLLHADMTTTLHKLTNISDVIETPATKKPTTESPKAEDVINLLQTGVHDTDWGTMIRSYIAQANTSQEVTDRINQLFDEVSNDTK